MVVYNYSGKEINAKIVYYGPALSGKTTNLEWIYSKIPVVLALKGRFHQLTKFFYNVSKLDRAISMENIRMTQPTLLPSGEVVVSVDVRATTYRRPPPK